MSAWPTATTTRANSFAIHVNANGAWLALIQTSPQTNRTTQNCNTSPTETGASRTGGEIEAVETGTRFRAFHFWFAACAKSVSDCVAYSILLVSGDFAVLIIESFANLRIRFGYLRRSGCR